MILLLKKGQHFVKHLSLMTLSQKHHFTEADLGRQNHHSYQQQQHQQQSLQEKQGQIDGELNYLSKKDELFRHNPTASTGAISNLHDDFEDMMKDEDNSQVNSEKQKKLIDYPENYQFHTNNNTTTSYKYFTQTSNEYLQQDNTESSEQSSEITDIPKGTTGNKKIPQCSQDILPIIQHIHVNNHLLAFFVKYQRFFSSLQYYALLQKMKQNVDDIKDIARFETNKQEEKLKAMQEKNPSAKMKYELEFLNTEQTKQHFGYAILLRNIQQKFAIYDARKSIQIMRVLTAFDKNLGQEFYDLIWERFLSLKEIFSTYELISYQFLLSEQNELYQQKINFTQQIEITNELLKRDQNEFTGPVINFLIKLRIIFPLYNVQDTNLVIAKCQSQILAQLDFFNTKHLLEIIMVCLKNGIHLEKEFIHKILNVIATRLPYEHNVKSKVVIQILKFFRKQQLYYLQRVNSQDPNSLGYGSSGRDPEDEDEQEEEMENQENNIQETSNNPMNKSLKNNGEGVRAVCEIENLFQLLLKSVLQDVKNGSYLKPYSLHSLLKTVISNDVKIPLAYEVILKEFTKATQKGSFWMFAKTYMLLSDYGMITQQLHQLSQPKIKAMVIQEQQYYLKMHGWIIHNKNDTFLEGEENKENSRIRNNLLNLEDTHQIGSVNTGEKMSVTTSTQISSMTDAKKINLSKILMDSNQLTQLLLKKISFSVTNLWSYLLNSLQFKTAAECDIVLIQTAIEYSNLVIDDIVQEIKSQDSVTINLIQQAQHINNFIETQKLTKQVPYLAIAKLVGNQLIEIIDTHNQLSYSTKIELLFLLQRKYFMIKYNPYIEKNALVKELIFDLKLNIQKINSPNKKSSNIPGYQASVNSECILVNFINANSVNHEGKERGLPFMNRYFAFTKKIHFVGISYVDFLKYIRHHQKQEYSKDSSFVLPNFLENKLGMQSFKFEFTISPEVQSTLKLFDEQISLLFQEATKELSGADDKTFKNNSNNLNNNQQQQTLIRKQIQ